jgi:hypothetical protein
MWLIEFIQPVGGLFLGRIVNLDDVGDVIISVRRFARTRGRMAELPVGLRISRISPLNTCDVHTLFRSAGRWQMFRIAKTKIGGRLASALPVFS